MNKYKDAWEVSSAAEWEGGLFELITGYGVSEDELPDSFPPEITEAWIRVRAVDEDIRAIQKYLNDHKDDEEEE